MKVFLDDRDGPVLRDLGQAEWEDLVKTNPAIAEHAALGGSSSSRCPSVTS